MPNLYRWTLFFEEPRQGWSESWYLVREGQSNRAILTDMRDVVRARANLLGARAATFHHRISQVSTGVPGVPVLRKYLGEDMAEVGEGNSNASPPDVSLLVQCTNGDGDKHKNVYLAGCPADVFGNVQNFTPSAAYTTLVNAWAAMVKAKGLGWLTQTVDQDLLVNSYIFDPLTGRTKLNLDVQLSFAPKQTKKRVSVNMPPGHEALDGVYLVGPVDDTPLSVITSKPRPSKSSAGLIGNLKSYTLAPVLLGPVVSGQPEATIIPQRAVKRSRGKVSYASVGRRPGPVRW